jgi:hypothetical protein
MVAKLDGQHVEPNSGLGQAIGYMLKHCVASVSVRNSAVGACYDGWR